MKGSTIGLKLTGCTNYAFWRDKIVAFRAGCYSTKGLAGKEGEYCKHKEEGAHS